jgi:hypothetical protein
MDQAHGSLQTTESHTRILSFAVPFFLELSSECTEKEGTSVPDLFHRSLLFTDQADTDTAKRPSLFPQRIGEASPHTVRKIRTQPFRPVLQQTQTNTSIAQRCSDLALHNYNRDRLPSREV